MRYYTAEMENRSLNKGEQPMGLNIPDGIHYKSALRIFKEYALRVQSSGTLYSNDMNTESIMNSWEVKI